jgi:hypothetical protein
VGASIPDSCTERQAGNIGYYSVQRSVTRGDNFLMLFTIDWTRYQSGTVLIHLYVRLPCSQYCRTNDNAAITYNGALLGYLKAIGMCLFDNITAVPYRSRMRPEFVLSYHDLSDLRPFK